ncbi:berberine bridge enzyme-like 2 [Andrographis paniculata]|uniref:berberine bridge enzyme-like 2 n=1 Tax=Andrographis paniculata TaxID=175694 RepID=UPI0021E6FD58|nr:berberine bridge enzyme-like 2 [Andrographis paniculata]
MKSYHMSMEKYLLICPFLFLLNPPILASPTSIYDAVFECFQNHKFPKPQIPQILYNPTNPSFQTLLQSTVRNRRFNTTATPKPAAIIAAAAESHVTAAVICAAAAQIPLRIRSGGHDFEGTSYVSDRPFLLLDMSGFRSIAVSPAGRTAWVDAGATLGELYYEISKKTTGLAFPGGVCPTVAAAGHISGGGYGNLIRKYGLTVDHVIDARVVVADGRVLDRGSMGEDLFWAIRGGGGASFCVVLAFRIRLVPVPATVTVFRVEKSSIDGGVEALYKYQQVAGKIDDGVFIRVVVSPVSVNGSVVAGTRFIGMFAGNASRVLSIMESEFPELGLRMSDCREMPWIESVVEWAGVNGVTSLLDRKPNSATFVKRKSDYVKNLIPKSGLESIFKKVVELRQVIITFNPYGGAMSRIPESSTPFPHRAGNIFKIQYSVSWGKEGEVATPKYINMMRQLYSFMTPYVSQNPREAYLNYRDLDIGTMGNSGNSYEQGKVYGLKYFKGNFDRLVKVKTEVDPNNVFRNEQSIPLPPF